MNEKNLLLTSHEIPVLNELLETVVQSEAKEKATEERVLYLTIPIEKGLKRDFKKFCREKKVRMKDFAQFAIKEALKQYGRAEA